MSTRSIRVAFSDLRLSAGVPPVSVGGRVTTGFGGLVAPATEPVECVIVVVLVVLVRVGTAEVAVVVEVVDVVDELVAVVEVGGATAIVHVGRVSVPVVVT
jgi:hypothetical protein